MKSFKFLNNIIGWAVFAVAATVYVLSAESTGSLWDCGEFIAGAHKLQVVHPPGAPLFLLIGRMFTFVAEVFTDTEAHPENIAYAVNVMSGICTAFAVLFIFWSTTILSRMVLVGRNAQEELSTGQSIAVLGSGIVAGLAATFATSVWFSAVEGEVYAMSTFFTTLVMWAGFKWYNLPDESNADRWLVFAAYMAGLSIGVHLLSLLSFPLLGILYVLKKNENASFMKMMIGASVGVGALVLVQGIIILKFPGIAAGFDRFFVNSLGLPPYSGVLFFIAVLITGIVFGLRYAHQKVNPNWQKMIIAFAMVLVGFSTYGVVVLRAYANTPINMNNPSDVYSLVSYLNREQYGDRPLLYGPHFDAAPIGQDISDRYGYVVDANGNGSYKVVDRKLAYTYRPQDKMFFPRIGHYDRKAQHRGWMGGVQGRPTMADNMSFFFQYQISWMYARYFMWNFVGRQNGDQGYMPQDVSQGNWLSGIKAVDESRLHNMDEIPRYMEENQARNTYFFLPFLFGFIGLIFHFSRRTNEAWAVLAMFLMTGLAIIIYSNQPPNEPRERDYVLAGSMMTFCIWIGMSVVAIYSLLEKRGLPALIAAVLGTGLAISAPIIMGTQNWDDHDRSAHSGARDYAINFLETCEPNAIIFTHGDNDTYPLWYAQEVENIRTDVRVVNLSLLAVDWYINQLRRQVNNSPKIEMSIPESAYRGYPRNFLRYNDAYKGFVDINKVVEYIGKDQNGRGGSTAFVPTRNISIPVDKSKVLANGTVMPSDTGRILDAINFTIPKKSQDANRDGLQKDEIAILDILASNNWDRPIYFSVTCRPEKLLGLKDYLQLEGMGFRIVPIKSQSDGRFGMLGNGRIAVDSMYNNIMTKFKWGNFDKEQLFVDRSYNPSVYSMRGAMIRLATTMLQEGDAERAMNVADKCLEVYPNMNFPYENQTLSLLRIYEQAGNLDRGKKHVITLATEFADRMNFYKSLTKSKAIATFNNDNKSVQGGIQQLIQMVDASGNEELKNEVKTILANEIAVQNIPN
ncbi:MAG: hypothetical protein ACI97N_000608 [Cognaticolwellia sp.]|mgnify:CR=1 FL=1|jgi:hypothetical protein